MSEVIAPEVAETLEVMVEAGIVEEVQGVPLTEDDMLKTELLNQERPPTVIPVVEEVVSE